MTAPLPVVYVCECRHRKARHQGGRYWCQVLCSCRGYRPDFTRPDPKPDAPLMPGGESTSVRLRKVEQERDEALADRDRANDDVADALAARDEALAAQARIGDRMTEDIVRLTAYRRQRDEARAEVDRLAGLLSLERHTTAQLRARLTERQGEAT